MCSPCGVALDVAFFAGVGLVGYSIAGVGGAGMALLGGAIVIGLYSAEPS